MTKDEALRLALEALYNLSHYADTCELFLKETHPSKADALRQRVTNSIKTIAAIKAALEVKDEPVAWRTFDGEGGYDYRTYENNEDYANDWDKRNPKHKGWVEPLYTTPPQRKPLTDEEIFEIIKRIDPDTVRLPKALRQLARAIEAAHGIKGEA